VLGSSLSLLRTPGYVFQENLETQKKKKKKSPQFSESQNLLGAFQKLKDLWFWVLEKNSKEFHSSHERASQKTGGCLMYIL
jgi:hypothetical protein